MELTLYPITAKYTSSLQMLRAFNKGAMFQTADGLQRAKWNISKGTTVILKAQAPVKIVPLGNPNRKHRATKHVVHDEMLKATLHL